MATSIGQYASVFLPEELPFLTEKPGRPPSIGSQRAGHYRSEPAHIGLRLFFLPVAALPQWEASVKVSAAAWLAGTLAAPSLPGHGLPLLQELWPYQSLFWASCSWWSEGLFGQSFPVALPIQALRGIPCLGSFSVVQRISHLKRHPGWGPTL